VIALPPVFAGALKLTVAWRIPALAVTPVGTPATVPITAGVTLLDVADGRLMPAAFLAVTVKL
jgi:hypothetical protein